MSDLCVCMRNVISEFNSEIEGSLAFCALMLFLYSICVLCVLGVVCIWGVFWNVSHEGDTTCECGLATENTAPMMQCTLLAQPCSLDDLNKFNDTAKKCVEKWKTPVR